MASGRQLTKLFRRLFTVLRFQASAPLTRSSGPPYPYPAHEKVPQPSGPQWRSQVGQPPVVAGATDWLRQLGTPGGSLRPLNPVPGPLCDLDRSLPLSGPRPLHHCNRENADFSGPEELVSEMVREVWERIWGRRRLCQPPSCSAQTEKMPRHVHPFNLGPEPVTHRAPGKVLV